MSSKSPKFEDWEKLYQAAVSFKKLKPWEWMYDDDIFGVKSPKTNKIYYCSIMGSIGEHFGISAYIGTEGLNGVIRILSGEIEPEDPDAIHIPKCLIASFENREMLSEEDRKIIRQLGYKFRGKNEWPLFRIFNPGFLAWYINRDECLLLTDILTQAIHVAVMCKEDGEILFQNEKPRAFLVRVPKEKNGIIEWHNEYLEAAPYMPKFSSFYLQDEIKIRKLKQIDRRRGTVWEIDTFFSPAPVKDKKIPYYPKMCLIMDQTKGLVLNLNMVKDINKEGFKFIDMFIELIENLRRFPSRVLVQREETYYLFKKICNQLEIPLEMVDRLQILDDARYEMYNYLNNRF